MTSDTPCIAALRAQENIDARGVADAIAKLSAVKPLIRCHHVEEPAQHLARSLATILARIFPEVHLDIRGDHLAQVVREEIRSAHASALIGSDLEARPAISVAERADDAYFADASGWRLRVASPGQEQLPVPGARTANPASALLAATLVTSRVLSDIPDLVEARPASQATRINLWHPSDNVDGPSIPQALAVDTHCFGHGSISNAVWGALERWPTLRGDVVVVDHDTYEERNRARYTFLPFDKVGTPKVFELKARLSHHANLRVVAHAERIQAWRRTSDERPRLALICPDNRPARAWAADTLPLLAVAASASEREAQVALCNPDGGICAYCLYTAGHTTPASQRDAIVAFTGLALKDVIRFTAEWNGRQSERLDAPSVRLMESTRGRSAGEFDRWIGAYLLDFVRIHQEELYSAATVRSRGADRIHMPLPLASAAAGALALAGLLRMTIAGFAPDSCEFNHMRLDVWKGELICSREGPPGSLTCLCQHPARRTWRNSPNSQT